MCPQSVKHLPAGSLLAHYRLEELIGEGAMGVVYRAHDEGLDRTVAVKVLRPAVSGMTVRVDRFFREARAAARISHPNLTHVYYVGGDGSYRFFAMEYVTGQTLEELLESSGPVDLETSLDILIQAARGLAAAHGAGIVHRDVKPSNILLREDGTVKVTDFGLSKSLEGDVQASQDGTVTGTPTYMSPEQCRGQKVDARTDIYALGLAAWTLLMGRPPFPGPNLGRVIDDQINSPLPPMRTEHPELPNSLENAVRRMCAKKPSDRPDDMSAVVAMLEGCRPRAVYPASIMARAVAATIDLALAGLVYAGVSVLLQRLAGVEFGESRDAMFLSLVFIASTLFLELRHSFTLGKWFLHMRVRSADGTDPPSRAVVMRQILRFPGLVLSATGLPLLMSEFDTASEVLSLAAVLAGILCFYFAKGWSFSDLLTRTRVVYDMPADARERRPRAADQEEQAEA